MKKILLNKRKEKKEKENTKIGGTRSKPIC